MALTGADGTGAALTPHCKQAPRTQDYCASTARKHELEYS